MSKNTDYDLVVLGAGPGGYNAAEKAASAGLSTVIIEQENIGGVCLNWGCIPTKTLLAAAKHYHTAQSSGLFGVTSTGVSMDWQAAQAHKNNTVSQLTRGVSHSLKSKGVSIVKGTGRLLEAGTVEAEGTQYHAPRILLATGSYSWSLPIPGKELCMHSTDILELADIPGALTIIGAGVIGIEFASLFSTLGTQVTVLELEDEILPQMDRDLASVLRKRLEPSVNFILGARVERIDQGSVVYSPKTSGKNASPSRTVSGEGTQSIPWGDCPPLMATGRRPRTANMGFEQAGLALEAGAIVVDRSMKTNLPGVWAVGDCTGKSQLAHAAYRMGEVAVSSMLGNPACMRYETIPSVVYSLPEAASVGLTGRQAADQGLDTEVAMLPLQYSGRYMAEHPGEAGMVKIVAEVGTGRLLGAHMVGGPCSEIIWGAGLLVETELCVSDMKELVFPHPTVSEIFHDALWTLKS